MVYVISKGNTPLMPCCNAVARLLLNQGKAKVKRKTPFTIKLTHESTHYKQLLTLGIDKDRIHLLIEYNPTQSILSIIRLLKQISAYRIWRCKQFKLLLRKNFWRENTFWNDGYFACSIGMISEEIIKRYISEQG